MKAKRMDWLGWATLVACLVFTGCATRKVDDGIYRVKSGGRWYVTDCPKCVKEIKYRKSALLALPN